MRSELLPQGSIHRQSSLSSVGATLLLLGMLVLCMAADATTLSSPAPDALDLPGAVSVADALRQRGRHVEAIPYQRRALDLALERFGPRHRKVAKLSLRLASSYLSTARPELAEPLARSALEIRTSSFGPQHRSLVAPLMVLAHVDLSRWQLDSAERRFRRALRLREDDVGPEAPQILGPLCGLGMVHLSQGKRADAESVLARVLEIADGAGSDEQLVVAKRLVTFATRYRKLGRFVTAETLYRRALSIQESALGPNHPVVSKTLQALAKTYLALGRVDDAEKMLERALRIRERAHGEAHPSVGPTASMLADVYRRQDRYAESLQLARRAHRLTASALGLEHLKTARALSVLARIHQRLGELDRARDQLGRALDIVQSQLGARHPALADILTASAKLELAAGNASLAIERLRRAIALHAAGSNHPKRAHRLAVLSEALASERRWEEALVANRAATAIMRHRLDNAADSGLAGSFADSAVAEQSYRRGVFIKHVRALNRTAARDRQAAEEAFEVGQLAQASDTARAVAAMATRFAEEHDRFAHIVREQQDAIERWRALDAWLLEQSSEISADRDLALEARQRETLAGLADTIRRLGVTLDREFPEYAAIATQAPASAVEIQRLLKPGEALVSFLFGAEHGYQWIVRPDRLLFRRIRGLGRERLADQVGRIRASLDLSAVSRVSDLPAFDAATAHALYASLLLPVSPALEGVEHLLIVPDGALHSLPLGVLLMREAGGARLEHGTQRDAAWLARRYALSTLPSASSLRALREFSVRSRASRPFVGFGDPVLGGAKATTRSVRQGAQGGLLRDPSELHALPRLPETAEELRRMAALLEAGEDTVFLGEAATESRARSIDLTPFRVVAFATHGLLGGQIGNEQARYHEPALVLTPPRSATVADDGLLSMSEIAELKLNADWVVLSACNTAGTGAPGVPGLARAFFFAGSRALLVSHWPVESSSAARLTTGTFSALRDHPGIGRAEALRRSMMTLLDDTSESHLQHPSFWAPFQLVGEGGVQAR